MPRVSRMVIHNQTAVYHVMSRTALDGFPLEAFEKDFLLELIKRMSGLFFTEVYGFALMGNHFHLLVKMIPEDRFSDEEVKERLELFYGEKKGDGRGGAVAVYPGKAFQPFRVCPRDQGQFYQVLQQTPRTAGILLGGSL